MKFNNLAYDNHICYARIREGSLYDLFIKSQNLINAPIRKTIFVSESSKTAIEDSTYFRKELPKEIKNELDKHNKFLKDVQLPVKEIL